MKSKAPDRVRFPEATVWLDWSISWAFRIEIESSSPQDNLGDLTLWASNIPREHLPTRRSSSTSQDRQVKQSIINQSIWTWLGGTSYHASSIFWLLSSIWLVCKLIRKKLDLSKNLARPEWKLSKTIAEPEDPSRTQAKPEQNPLEQNPGRIWVRQLDHINALS